MGVPYRLEPIAPRSFGGPVHQAFLPSPRMSKCRSIASVQCIPVACRLYVYVKWGTHIPEEPGRRTCAEVWVVTHITLLRVRLHRRNGTWPRHALGILYRNKSGGAHTGRIEGQLQQPCGRKRLTRGSPQELHPKAHMRICMHRLRTVGLHNAVRNVATILPLPNAETRKEISAFLATPRQNVWSRSASPIGDLGKSVAPR